MDQKIGLIGVGNMGTAIIQGLIQKSLIEPSQVTVFDKLTEKAHEFEKTVGVQVAEANRSVVKTCEVVILAVKPQDLAATIAEFSEGLTDRHILISILAGTPLKKIREYAGDRVKLVRAMPNLGAIVGSSITALYSQDAHALEISERIFSGCGETLRLDEGRFDAVTALSGSGPAYFFLLMELLTREALAYGFEPKDAEKLAVYTALGAGKLARLSLDQGESAESLRKKVTSKGGTTEAALKVFFEKGYPELFHSAVEAAHRRGQELSLS